MYIHRTFGDWRPWPKSGMIARIVLEESCGHVLKPKDALSTHKASIVDMTK